MNKKYLIAHVPMFTSNCQITLVDADLKPINLGSVPVFSLGELLTEHCYTYDVNKVKLFGNADYLMGVESAIQRCNEENNKFNENEKRIIEVETFVE